MRRAVPSLRLTLGIIVLGCLSSGGCYLLNPATPEPKNNYRPETGQTVGTGVDSRAKQIESNLGYR
jgi:hypothetical protein